MTKVKYYYDPDTLSYRKIEPKKSRKYRNITLFLLGSALFGFMGLMLLLNTNLLNTPKELALQREVNNFELRFELLNRKMDQMEQVLANIEQHELNVSGDPVMQQPAGASADRISQLDLFRAPTDQLAETLRQLDLDGITPIEALNLLAELRTKVDRES